MLKSNAIILGVAAAGVIAASPAVAARLIAPTQTRSAASLPAPSVTLSSFSTAFATQSATVTRRQSPLLVPGDSPG